MRCGRDQLLDRGEIVVAADQKLERRVQRAAMAAEIKHAAVIAAGEDQDLGPAGDRARGTDRHQIGLGAGIGEAHQLDRREARAHRRGKTRLGLAMRAEIEPAGQRVLDRAANRRVRMAVDPGGELAEEIGVFVPVEVPQMRPLAARHRQWERVDMDRGAGVAARHRGTGLAVLGEALRVLRPVLLLGFGERRREIDVGGLGLDHLCPEACGASGPTSFVAAHPHDKPDDAQRGYSGKECRLICASALRIGELDTVINPSNGVSISTIRKMQAARAPALRKNVVSTVALRGAL